MRNEKQPDTWAETFVIAVLAAYILFSSGGCVYLPRCTEVHYKSVVTKDEGTVRDVLAEAASPAGGDNSIGYNP